jgi:hypothetical protein
VTIFSTFTADDGQGKLCLGLGELLAGRSAQNGGSCTGTLYTANGTELSAVCILLRQDVESSSM